MPTFKLVFYITSFLKYALSPINNEIFFFFFLV